MKRRIAVVTATRAEYGLLFCLLKHLSTADDVDLQLIVSGTHLSASHGLTVQQIEADGFTIAARVNMEVGDDSPQGVARSLATALNGFAEAMARLAPDLLVLLGDRYELLAAAQAAMLLRVPIAHIHGGESTEGAMDEAVRHALTKMSHLHFAATDHFARRIVQMGEAPGRVFVTGAPGLDNIDRLDFMTRAELEAVLAFPLGNPCFLVTYHPETLSAADPAEAFGQLLEVLDEFDSAHVLLTGTNADPGAGAIAARAQAYAHARPGRVLLRESLGQRRYLSAMRHADVVIGNSSSGLLEAPALGTPSVNIGTRQQGRPAAPSVISCPAEAAAIKAAVLQALSAEHRALAAHRNTPYGGPGASERIARVLRSHPLSGILIKRFHDAPGAP